MAQENVVRIFEENEHPIPTEQITREKKTPAQAYRYIATVNAFLEAQKARGTPLTQAEFARRIGYAPSTFSRYMAGKYAEGDVEKMEAAIAEVIRLENVYQTFNPNITEIAETGQIMEIRMAIEEIVNSRSFGIIVGEAGVGKTVALEAYEKAHRSNTLLITLDPSKARLKDFVEYVWESLPGKSRGKKRALPKTSFLINDLVLHFRRNPRTLLIDEAQWLSELALETARSIQDKTRIGIVLAGTFDINEAIGLNNPDQSNAQLLSRVKVRRVVEPNITQEDLTGVVGLYGVHDPEIVAWLLARCNRPARRYRWVDAILVSAYARAMKQGSPLDVDALEFAAVFSGLV